MSCSLQIRYKIHVFRDFFLALFVMCNAILNFHSSHIQSIENTNDILQLGVLLQIPLDRDGSTFVVDRKESRCVVIANDFETDAVERLLWKYKYKYIIYWFNVVFCFNDAVKMKKKIYTATAFVHKEKNGYFTATSHLLLWKRNDIWKDRSNWKGI